MVNSISKTSFYNDIRHILHSARFKAYSAVNTAMVEAYWLIGKRIVEENSRAKGGQTMVRS